MTTTVPSDLPPDPLAALAHAEVQTQAARLVQEAFNAAFRLSLEGSPEQAEAALDKLARHLDEWATMATHDETLLRRALLLVGLDQWGLAFMQAFGSGGLRGLSVLLGRLRDVLEIDDEAACQQHFARIQAEEACALDFKIALRRELHLTLWHAMIACESREDAVALLKQLGGMMLALTRDMPTQGWRLVADALASIQIRCLTHGLAVEGLAQEITQELFASLYAGMEEGLRSRTMQASSQAVVAWQQARRATQH